MTDDDIREAFEERAAIQEFDGHLPRAEAERQAREWVRTRYRLTDELVARVTTWEKTNELGF